MRAAGALDQLAEGERVGSCSSMKPGRNQFVAHRSGRHRQHRGNELEFDAHPATRLLRRSDIDTNVRAVRSSVSPSMSIRSRPVSIPRAAASSKSRQTRTITPSVRLKMHFCSLGSRSSDAWRRGRMETKLASNWENAASFCQDGNSRVADRSLKPASPLFHWIGNDLGDFFWCFRAYRVRR